MMEAGLIVVMYHVQHPANVQQKLAIHISLLVANSVGHVGVLLVRLSLCGA